MKRTYIDGETAIKPYYYLRNGALHVRFTSDRCIQLSKDEEKRLKNEMTEKPYDKQEILESAWKFYADCVKKTVIQDGIAYADSLIERLKNEKRDWKYTFQWR